LAKWGPNDGTSYVNGNVMGTHGYVGPEYKTGGNFLYRQNLDFSMFNDVLLENSQHPSSVNFELLKPGYKLVDFSMILTLCDLLGKLYVKSDVYSFGVVLIELLTGLRAIDKKRPPKQQDLQEWALPFLTDRKKLRQIMDPRLQGKYGSKQALKIAMLAVRCLYSHPMIRPSMKEVAETLERVKLRT
jgi:serine/threonine protein kinase